MKICFNTWHKRAAAVSGIMAAAAVAPTPVVAEVVTNYRNDFQDAGWAYLWNAPSDWNGTANPASTNLSTGGIGSVADYEPLVFADGYYSGNGGLPSQAPASFLRLDAVNVQPGAVSGAFYDVDPGAAENFQENTHDRYAIAAFTVTQAGTYGITDSFLTISSAASDGIEVLIHIDSAAPVYSQLMPGGTAGGPTTSNFNTSLGNLTAGQTIYVSFGSGVTADNDFAQVDFDISRVPEPSSLALTGVGLALIAARKRRV